MFVIFHNVTKILGVMKKDELASQGVYFYLSFLFYFRTNSSFLSKGANELDAEHLFDANKFPKFLLLLNKMFGLCRWQDQEPQ